MDLENAMTMSNFDDVTHDLASRVLDAARQKNARLGSAESCTGGLVAAALTAIPGSSDVFVGGIVSYWIDVKESLLGVDGKIIDAYGVVSEECARAMASCACERLGCDYAVSTTGIAGPGGAEPGKPIGTVCCAVASRNTGRCVSFTTCKGSTRDEVRNLAVISVLEALYTELSN